MIGREAQKENDLFFTCSLKKYPSTGGCFFLAKIFLKNNFRILKKRLDFCFPVCYTSAGK